MKKSERIYNETRYRTRKHIETWGYDPKVSFHGWHTETLERPDGELIYTRTQNELLKMLKRDRKDVGYQKQYNIISEDEYILRNQVLDMMEKSAKSEHPFKG